MKTLINKAIRFPLLLKTGNNPKLRDHLRKPLKFEGGGVYDIPPKPTVTVNK
jgi:hypothetical protein